jgi:TRAP-type mannitol/chloroaromatic compound transport system substrate-binding protein
MKKIIGILAAMALGTTTAQAQDVTLRLSHWLPPQHAVPQTGMKEWMESITEASGGSIQFEVFPAQQLGAAPDHYDMTRDGIADIGYANPGYNAGRFPVFELVGVPFLGKDGANSAKAIHEWYLDYAGGEMSDVYFCLVNPHNPGRFPRQHRDQGSVRRQRTQCSPGTLDDGALRELARRLFRAGAGAGSA